MCQTFGNHSEQIEKFVENGMPQKIVKTVQYTLRKRAQQIQCDCSSKETALADVAAAAVAADVASNALSTTTTTKTNAITTKNDDIVQLLNHDAGLETLKDDLLLGNQQQQQQQQLESKIKIPKMCGRFRANANKNVNKDNNKESTNNNNESNIDQDWLGTSTRLTKQFAEQLALTFATLQNGRIYTILTKTTQPAHLIGICILSFVVLSICPELMDYSSGRLGEDANMAEKATAQQGGNKIFMIIAYLAAFSTHFGSQIWMTFVSGLSLYFSLPRHIFGQCQQILFPKYFALNAVLSIGMLIIFVKYFLNTWSFSVCVQLLALLVMAVFAVIIRLYFAPPMLLLMHEKYKIEGAIGSGQEVGNIQQGDLANCPHYQRIHKAFRRKHMIIAIGNMTVLLAACLHLYFLASKIQMSLVL